MPAVGEEENTHDTKTIGDGAMDYRPPEEIPAICAIRDIHRLESPAEIT
jgi:hypothetical protein